MSEECQEKWQWELTSQKLLLPWFKTLSNPEAGYIKNLPHRKVFRVRTLEGENLYIKQSLCVSHFSRLKFFFQHPLHREFQTLCELHQAHIPSIEAIGYGCCRDQELLITRSLENCMTALEFWHTLAIGHSEETQAFLQELTLLLKILKKQKYIHKDFHPENILFQQSSSRLFIVDPYKLEHCLPWQTSLQNLLYCNGLLFLENRLSDSEIIKILIESEISENETEASLLLKKARARHRKIYLHKRPKRIRKLLAGTSQYSRIEIIQNRRLHIRNTPWNTCRNLNLEKLRKTEYSPEQAKSIWIESILPLPGCSSDLQPLAWLENPEAPQKDFLFFQQ